MSLSTGRDIASVILVLEAIVLGLLPLAAFYYAIRGMRSLRSWLDPKITLAQAQLAHIARSAQTISGYMVSPVLALSSRRQQARGAIQALLHGASPALRPEAPEIRDPLAGERGGA